MGKSIAIGIVVAISIVHYSILGYLGYDPMPESQSLMGWCFSLTLALWCLDDAKRQRFIARMNSAPLSFSSGRSYYLPT